MCININISNIINNINEIIMKICVIYNDNSNVY